MRCQGISDAGAATGKPCAKTSQKLARKLRKGWAEDAAQMIATQMIADGEGELILGDFDDDADAELWVWEEKTE